MFKILTINPGSTSTKIAVYADEEQVFEKVIRHSQEQLNRFDSIIAQKEYREELILDALREQGIGLEELHAIVGRGGLIDPIDSGTYLVNDAMLRDLIDTTAAVHASSLGGIIAAQISKKNDLPCYVVDPVVVDEMDQMARLTGIPGIERKSVFHALNQKAVARRCAGDMGLDYENCRFIVAHMGGGITVGAHRYGRVIDVNDGISGEGPFSPERAGAVPLTQIIKMCFSGAYSEQEMLNFCTKSGGMCAYLGTNDLRKCERLIKEGDEYASLVMESMAYQVAKEIGAMFAVLEGRVDAIILTGGLAYSTRFTGEIKEHVSLIAPVKVYAGEDEMLALAQGALRVLRGETNPLEYC